MAKNIEVDSDKLRKDRDQSGLSREALIARIEENPGPDISISSLRRAEQGSASMITIQALASALGFDTNRYLLASSRNNSNDTNLDLTGEWLAYYSEDDVEVDPYTSIELLRITQQGHNISGTSESYQLHHPAGIAGKETFGMNGTVINDVLIGHNLQEGTSKPLGSGVFQLKFFRDGVWGDGACTFFADDGKIMVSRYIWIKRSSAQFSLMKEQAPRLLEKDRILFSIP